MLIQKQISAALNNKPNNSKPKFTNLNVCCNYCKEQGHVKNDYPKLAVKKACDATNLHLPTVNLEVEVNLVQPTLLLPHGKPLPLLLVNQKPKLSKIKPGIGVPNVASGTFLMAPQLILKTSPKLPMAPLLPQPINKTHLSSTAWSCLMNDFLARFFIFVGPFGSLC